MVVEKPLLSGGSAKEMQKPSRVAEEDESKSLRNCDSNISHFSPDDTKKLLRKLDINMVPILALLYLLSFLDRTNIGNARLFGLEKDLEMKGLDYNIALAVFFPAYVIAEVPSNMMLKRFGARIWLPTIMVLWSIVVIAMGFVTSFSGLVIARAFLGFAEGGLFPGVTYYITSWYRRHECSFRIALFFSAATAAGAFGGLLARGIGEMEGLGGYSGWSWLFIIEGLMTLVVAIGAFWVIVDSPEGAKFLTPAERQEVTRRLKDDQDDLADDFKMEYVWDALKDWKIYVQMLTTFGTVTPLYSISLFLPTIIKSMGYSNHQSQLLTIPPYVAACTITIAAGYATDRVKVRGPFMLGFCLVAMLGWVMLLASGKPAVQYTGTFFAAAGVFPLIPVGVAWNSNNIGGSLKRGVGIAMQVASGNLGGVVSAFIYLSKNSPRFISGHAILVGLITMAFCLSLTMTTYSRRENRRRDRWAAENDMLPENYTEEQRYMEREKGDNASFFRYTT